MPAPKKNNPYGETQLLPTPPVGWPILWYRNDQDATETIAAICVKIEAPGQVKIAVLAPDHVVHCRGGVHWWGDDRRMSPGRPYRRNGCWSFIEGLAARDAMKEHKVVLDRRLALLVKEQEARDAAMRAAQEHHERIKADATQP